jgi:Flp pilus assembly pilin Flp
VSLCIASSLSDSTGNPERHIARVHGSAVRTKEMNRMLKYFVAAQAAAMNAYDDLRSRENGQTMAEYGVVLAVITLGVVAALGFLSGGIGRAIDGVTSKLPGA